MAEPKSRLSQASSFSLGHQVFSSLRLSWRLVHSATPSRDAPAGRTELHLTTNVTLNKDKVHQVVYLSPSRPLLTHHGHDYEQSHRDSRSSFDGAP
jgi:hypothetical protein